MKIRVRDWHCKIACTGDTKYCTRSLDKDTKSTSNINRFQRLCFTQAIRSSSIQSIKVFPRSQPIESTGNYQACINGADNIADYGNTRKNSHFFQTRSTKLPKNRETSMQKKTWKVAPLMFFYQKLELSVQGGLVIIVLNGWYLIRFTRGKESLRVESWRKPIRTYLNNGVNVMVPQVWHALVRHGLDGAWHVATSSSLSMLASAP